MLGWRLAVFAAVVAVGALLPLGRAHAQPLPAVDIARGEHLATALAGCTDCHGSNFAGGRSFTRAGQTVYASNLTGGAGGIAAYSDADLRRAIRAGVRPDGTQLRVMPWREYAVLTDADVADLIAFLRTLPAVDRTVEPPPAAVAPPSVVPAAPAPDGGVVRQPLTDGAYLATIGGCTNCHGADLKGGHVGAATAPDISRTGIGNWSFADFSTAMHVGKTPDGRELSPAMPWRIVGKLTPQELRAVYDFLESTATGN